MQPLMTSDPRVRDTVEDPPTPPLRQDRPVLDLAAAGSAGLSRIGLTSGPTAEPTAGPSVESALHEILERGARVSSDLGPGYQQLWAALADACHGGERLRPPLPQGGHPPSGGHRPPGGLRPRGA